MYAVKMFRYLLRNKQFVSPLSGQLGTVGALSAQSGIRGNAVASEYSGALSKRFQSSKPFTQCTNTCKCPNSEKINQINSLVLPTYFLKAF